jgi:hypothetical protein
VKTCPCGISESSSAWSILTCSRKPQISSILAKQHK